ncbi:MAG: PQQ-binding-like beta-propeller repeat protein, partial [Acidimicrobiia bacterium]|nr:PQQ-binding-like beta-propeller repeat protein [Acidimicrobiia bacterium]
PHWPSVAVNSGYAYVARHDGGLYAVDLADEDAEEPAWSIYLGRADGQGNFPDGLQCNWGPEEGFSILASPAVSPEGAVVVGTLEGRILAVGDSDW